MRRVEVFLLVSRRFSRFPRHVQVLQFLDMNIADVLHVFL